MRSWIVMLWGLLIWAAHFFALYGIAEFAGPSAGSRAAVVLLTASALGLVALGAYRLRPYPTSGDFAGWSVRLGRGALLLSALAIVWQAFPAFLN
jgi:hypothetical protein